MSKRVVTDCIKQRLYHEWRMFDKNVPVDGQLPEQYGFYCVYCRETVFESEDVDTDKAWEHIVLLLDCLNQLEVGDKAKFSFGARHFRVERDKDEG